MLASEALPVMSKIEEQNYFTPSTVRQAVALRRRFKDRGLVVAGGTISVQMVSKMLIEPEAIICLEKLPLNYVKKRGKTIEIGATTPIAELVENRDIPDGLRQAVESFHGLALKEMATVGGNIFSPAPSGDIATALLSLDAELVLQGSRGQRIVPLTRFYKGLLQFNIKADEILTAIRINRLPSFSGFLNQRPWKYGGPTISSIAVAMDYDSKVKKAAIAVGGLTPHPYRATKTEKYLTGKTLEGSVVEEASAELFDGVEVLETGFASADYLKELTRVLFKRVMKKALHEG